MKIQIDSELFVVLCEDRHTDDEIHICASLEGAHGVVREFKERYSRYDVDAWYDPRPERFRREPGAWLYCAQASEDGPSVRIERKKLES